MANAPHASPAAALFVRLCAHLQKIGAVSLNAEIDPQYLQFQAPHAVLQGAELSYVHDRARRPS